MAWSIWQSLKPREEAKDRLPASPAPTPGVPIPSPKVLQEIFEVPTESEPVRKEAPVP